MPSHVGDKHESSFHTWRVSSGTTEWCSGTGYHGIPWDTMGYHGIPCDQLRVSLSIRPSIHIISWKFHESWRSFDHFWAIFKGFPSGDSHLELGTPHHPSAHSLVLRWWSKAPNRGHDMDTSCVSIALRNLWAQELQSDMNPCQWSGSNHFGNPIHWLVQGIFILQFVMNSAKIGLHLNKNHEFLDSNADHVG